MWRLYLDESGDLGFDFKEKKPSKFLTIAILATSQRQTVQQIGWAVKRTLRKKVNGKKVRHNELKGSNTTIAAKQHFYSQVSDCKFAIYAMTMNKRHVYEELCKNAFTKSRLYNYLAKQVLDAIPFEKANDAVELIVDRSKCSREIADFNNYIYSNLQSRFDPIVKMAIYHHDSCSDRGLSAIDLFCWGIFRRHERNDNEWYEVFQSKIAMDERYL